MNNYQFHRSQLEEDFEAIKKFSMDFLKSFGPSPKKIVDRPIGVFEAAHIRFRLSLVEMGISQVIRSVIVIIVGIIVYFTLFRYAGVLFKVIIALGFLVYYAWLMGPHLVEDFKLDGVQIKGKPTGIFSGYMVELHNFWFEFQEGFTSIFKTEKKK